ncbi:hypothetical protein ACIOJD_20980 [Streptomyces sp. NPDC088116]|uniref:hypothetical protein n=1 Tax=Streptomyces sp. NPDC088116 TaxID=3365825 RepID=UPI00381AB877
MQSGVGAEHDVLVDPLGDDRRQWGDLLARRRQDGLDRTGVQQPVRVVAGGAVAVARTVRVRQRSYVDAGPEPDAGAHALLVVRAEDVVQHAQERPEDEGQQRRIEAEHHAVPGVGRKPLGVTQLVKPGSLQGLVDEFGDQLAHRTVLYGGKAREVLRVDGEQGPVGRQRSALGVRGGNVRGHA